MTKRIKTRNKYIYKGFWHSFCHEGLWRAFAGLILISLFLGIPACLENKAKSSSSRYHHYSGHYNDRTDHQYFEDHINLLEEIRDELRKLNKEK